MNAITQGLLFELSPHPPDDPDIRFTLPGTLAWCAEKAGVTAWDLDVAACPEAHVAERYYAHAQNGLALPWAGRVWCNPPHSHLEPWLAMAWSEWEAGCCETIAMLIPGNRTEQRFWQEMVEPCRDRPGSPLRTYFLPGRTSFGRPDDPLGEHAGSPPFTCVLLVWRT